MSRRGKQRGRDIDGILVLDKPAGMTSSDAVQRIKRLFRARKVGHTGSLDPLATGVLPLCFGEATKFSQFLLDSDKRYRVQARLGIRTETGDAGGEVLERRDARGLTEADVEAVLERFRGEIEQVPSMYSAIKHQGQPLYKLARQGIEVEREPRRLRIYRNELVALEGSELEIELHCSKGTYVRSLIEELGELLGCGAHVSALRRLSAGPYDQAEQVTLQVLEAACEEGGLAALDRWLLPVSSAVRCWPVVTLSDATAYYVKQGQPVIVAHAPTQGWVRLMERVDAGVDAGDETGETGRTGEGTRFLGVGEILDDGRVAPRRLIVAH